MTARGGGSPLRLTAPIEALSSAILQVAVVWRGRIVGYRLLDRRGRITVGPGFADGLPRLLSRLLFGPGFGPLSPFRLFAWVRAIGHLVPDPTFVTPAIDRRARFRLLKPKRRGYALRLGPELGGEVQVSGEVQDAAIAGTPIGRSDVREVRLTPGDRAKLHFADSPDLKIEIRWVDPPETFPKPKIEDPMMFQTLVGTSIVLGLAAAALVIMWRPPDKPLALTTERVAKIETPVLEIEKKNTARRAAEKEEKKKQEEGQMKKAKEKAGKLGKQDATQKDTVIPKGEKDVLREKVAKVGILSIVGNQKQAGSGLSKLFAEDSAVEQAVAGMAGAKLVAGRGNGGLSTSGAGPGGGGTGYGHIYGSGNLDTGGRGTHGKGRGPKLAERGEREVSVGLGNGGGEADGSLSKEQINKVVRAHLAGVKYCYEKELQHKQSLSGGVDIFWVIQPDGSVSKASVKNTTLNDSATEGCILRQVKQWQFPKAPGQTIVGRYPFIFKGGT
jgi:hypothetical protein